MRMADSNGQKNVKRLITPYPEHRKADKVLEALGDDFYHDRFQDVDGKDKSAVAVEDGGAPSESSDDSVESDNDEPVGLTAVAVDANDEPVGLTLVPGDSAEAPVDEIKSTSTEILPLSDKQAEAVQQMHMSMHLDEFSIYPPSHIKQIRHGGGCLLGVALLVSIARLSAEFGHV